MTTYSTLQKIAQTRIDALAVELADRVSVRDRALAEIETLTEEMSGTAVPQTNDPLIDGAFAPYAVRLRQKRDQLGAHIKALEADIAKVRVALSEAYQEKVRFEHLSTLYRTAEETARSTREQAELDEVAVTKAAR